MLVNYVPPHAEATSDRKGGMRNILVRPEIPQELLLDGWLLNLDSHLLEFVWLSIQSLHAKFRSMHLSDTRARYRHLCELFEDVVRRLSIELCPEDLLDLVIGHMGCSVKDACESFTIRFRKDSCLDSDGLAKLDEETCLEEVGQSEKSFRWVQ